MCVSAQASLKNEPSGPNGNGGDVAFKFRLYLDSGEDVGDLVTAAPNWKPGDQFFDSTHTRYEVLDVIDLTDVVDPSEETESFLGALVVSPLELAEPA